MRRLVWFSLGAAAAIWGMRRGPALLAQARREGAAAVVDQVTRLSGRALTTIVARLTARKGAL